MKHRSWTLNLGNVEHATRLGRESLERLRKLVEDPESSARREAQECVLCYYSARIGGAAITERDCGGCGAPQQFMNTATDVLCRDCAKAYGLCKHCGADVALKPRRKLARS
jgi:hypothetical protein